MKEKLPITDRILNEKSPMTYHDLADELGIGVDAVEGVINKLQKQGFGFAKIGDSVVRTKVATGGDIFNYTKKFDPVYLHFGIVSDTHLSSKRQALDSLEKMYDIFVSEGVKQIFHAGDITDGVHVYKGHELEVLHYGQTEQIDYAIANYPKRDGLTTSFITGNHDLREYEHGGVDPGYQIAHSRKDLKYLGPITAKVKLPNGIEMELLHPDGGVAYALSYKPQRAINSLTSEDLPDILVYGHYHTTFYMNYRNINFLQAGCFKGAGLWEKRLGINPTIGGWIVDAQIGSGRIERFKPMLVKP